MASYPPTPSLVDLAKDILRQATTLQAELDKQSLPQPSFAPDGRRNYHDILFHPSAMAARAKLIDAAKAMHTLALGPADALRGIINTERTGVNVLRAIHELGIAEAVPSPPADPISIASLASALKVHPVPLTRLLRFAYTIGLFQEPLDKPDHVAHTPLSAAIPSFAPYIWLQLGDVSQTQAAGWEFAWALRNWPTPPLARSDAIVQGGRATPAEKGRTDFWAILEEDEPEGRGMELFTKSMKAHMQNMHGPSNRHFVVAFDWAALGEGGGVVVDVGGGNGFNVVPVAREVPTLRFVVQDLAKNEEAAKAVIKAGGLDLEEGRVRFQTHDFFTPQPVLRGEDDGEVVPKAYLVSRVLHDWPDEDCVRILTQLLPGLRKGAKLFVVERVLPVRPGEIPAFQEAQLRALDMMVYAILGACERSRDHWERLLREVDPGLVVKKITPLPGSELSAIEAGF